jgi:DNA-binding NarL/FixJ family response regulator
LRTVETHKHNILEKTGAKNLAGLVKFAIREKLFDDLFY